MAIFEEPEEASCVQHYVLSAWEPSFQRYAISLRASFIMPGTYVWFYSNGTLVQPHYTQWATGHPIDRGCVTMLLGDGIVHQGAWYDVDCVEDPGMFSVCERDKMSVIISLKCFIIIIILIIIIVIIILIIIVIIIVIIIFILAVRVREEAAAQTLTAARISPVRLALVVHPLY